MGIDTEKINKHIFLRVLLGLALIISCASVFQTESAEAGCGWGIHADTEGAYGSYAPCGSGESQDGTFKSELITDGDQGYFKITLNNYRGGSILYECYGTCGPSVKIKKVVVELVGDNAINAPNGRGIDTGWPIEFIGQGKLEVTAMFPFGGGYLCYWYNPPTMEEQSVCSFAPIEEDVAVKIKEALGTQTVFITPGTVTKETETPPKSQIGQSGSDIPAENEEGESDGNENEKKCPDSALAEQTSDSGWTVWNMVTMVYVGVSLLAFIGLTFRWFVKRKKASVSKHAVQQDHENNDDCQGDTQGVL